MTLQNQAHAAGGGAPSVQTAKMELKALIRLHLDNDELLPSLVTISEVDAAVASPEKPLDRPIDTIISATLTSNTTFDRSEWSAVEGPAGSAKVNELFDDLWAQRFNLVVDAIRARALYELDLAARFLVSAYVAAGEAVRKGTAATFALHQATEERDQANAAAKADAKKRDIADTADKKYADQKAAADTADKERTATRVAAHTATDNLARAQGRALALDGLLRDDTHGPRPTVDSLGSWMHSPVLVTCAEPAGVISLLESELNSIRQAVAPNIAPSGSRLTQSAVLIGSKREAQAVAWQVKDAATIVVKQEQSALEVTVTETVSAQAFSGACLVWLPFEN
jgi:hypothetical protein